MDSYRVSAFSGSSSSISWALLYCVAPASSPCEVRPSIGRNVTASAIAMAVPATVATSDNSCFTPDPAMAVMLAGEGLPMNHSLTKSTQAFRSSFPREVEPAESREAMISIQPYELRHIRRLACRPIHRPTLHHVRRGGSRRDLEDRSRRQPGRHDRQGIAHRHA